MFVLKHIKYTMTGRISVPFTIDGILVVFPTRAKGQKWVIENSRKYYAEDTWADEFRVIDTSKKMNRKWLAKYGYKKGELQWKT
jgi:hypothetical protein